MLSALAFSPARYIRGLRVGFSGVCISRDLTDHIMLAPKAIAWDPDRNGAACYITQISLAVTVNFRAGT